MSLPRQIVGTQRFLGGVAKEEGSATALRISAIVESKRQRISSPMHEGFHAEAEALLSCAKRLRS
jgi:hypothetical protein